MYFADIPQKQTTDFMLLDGAKMDAMHLFDCEVGRVYSREMIDAVGDVLPEGVVHVAMGVRG